MDADPSSRFALLKAIFLPLVSAALLLSARGSCPKPAQQLPDGAWKFCGDEVTFTEGAQSYTYKWTFDGAELRFTRVDDTVVTRIVYLTNHPWVLQK